MKMADFDDFLDKLKGDEESKEQSVRDELKRNYDQWEGYFHLLKDNFSQVWDLFATIEERVNGWYRGDGYSSINRDYMGESGNVYVFGAGIHNCGELDSPSGYSNELRGSKFIMVNFGPTLYQYGDERDIGFEKFVTLSNSSKLTERLSAAKRMLKRVRRQRLRVHIPGKCEFVGIDYLKTHNLRDVCQDLFVGVAQGEEINLKDYLASFPQLPSESTSDSSTSNGRTKVPNPWLVNIPKIESKLHP